MPSNSLLTSAWQRLRHSTHIHHPTPGRLPYEPNTSALPARLLDVFLRTYDLGFTSFGGPPVHFQIFHRRFVDGLGQTPWIDEQTYQELFAVCQAFPGPGSTKMLFNITQIHAGLLPALLVFLLWSLPSALSMYAFSLGIQHIRETLPGPAYALLSGLNAATVGLIALAAVQLARKAVTDGLTRFLVVFGGCAGVCYSALWYFPVLLVGGGCVTAAWDLVGRGWYLGWKRSRSGGRRRAGPELEAGAENGEVPMEDMKPVAAPEAGANQVVHRRPTTTPSPPIEEPTPPTIQPSQIDISAHSIPIKFGLSLLLTFFLVFAAFISLRSALHPAPRLLSLFTNMFLAGTIIFGGGPVVIPLLRDYVVAPGWVSPRDFLLGLAVIQAMPGPNFNFAVYLGALAVLGPSNGGAAPTFLGALLAFLGIFTPGLWLSLGFQSLWRVLRKRRAVLSVLRGVNAAAVGLACIREEHIRFSTVASVFSLSRRRLAKRDAYVHDQRPDSTPLEVLFDLEGAGASLRETWSNTTASPTRIIVLFASWIHGERGKCMCRKWDLNILLY
ncbi:chromate transporter-domain-containing protein [Lyophyllum atratum]|nr:chromate transporter-domain-containing protein [Lyophyllum atratum]